MERSGAVEAVFDPSQVEITEQDKHWDFVTLSAKSAPKIRNEYAHGSIMLHCSFLGTFEVVAELIRQLWPADEQGGDNP